MVNQEMKKSVFALPLICVLATTAGINVLTEHSKAQASTQPSIDLETLRDAALAKHNEYRKLHDAPPLQLDSGLNASAQAYAEELARRNEDGSANDPYFEHSNNRDGVGENLDYHATTNSIPSASALADKVVEGWYIEVNDYDFNNPGKQKPGREKEQIGHFTQVVWKETSKVGCGAATANITFNSGNKATGVFTVCHYSPGGNVRMMDDSQSEYVLYEQNVVPTNR
jgi:uncharacterized protein YkwD